MWPFFGRKKQQQEGTSTPSPRYAESESLAPRRRPMRFADLVNGMGGFDDFRNNDSALKFWLPDAANKALEEISGMNGNSMSEALRQLFVTHCYGIYAFQVMTQTNPNLFKDPGHAMFSRGVSEPPAGKKRVETYWVPELGKNVMPVKVWIPKRVRHDLQLLADHVGIKLSQYIREIVIARLLGHGTLPMRPEMLKAEPLPSADDWCEDRELALREATEREYRTHPLGERRVEWVDE